MAVQVLKDAKLWLAGYDLSGDMNALALTYGAELQDDTVLGDDTRSHMGGLKTLTFQHEGFWSGGTDAVDEVLFTRIGVANEVMTVGPETGADGEIAFTTPIVEGEYSPGAAVGEMFAFSVSGEGRDSLVRGTVMHNAQRTASGNGAARQLGSVSASQKLHAALHVVAASGSSPTLDVTVESDDASGFLSPTTRISFAQATAIGAQWASPVAGPITDDWWRVAWTIGGTSPDFTFIVVVGIQ
jgi:hypothetical protein